MKWSAGWSLAPPSARAAGMRICASATDQQLFLFEVFIRPLAQLGEAMRCDPPLTKGQLRHLLFDPD